MASSLLARSAAATAGIVGLVVSPLLDPAVATSSAAVGAASTHRAATQSVRVVTFNMRKDNTFHQHQLDWNRLQSHADVVFLQEVKQTTVQSLVDPAVWVVKQVPGTDAGEVALVARRDQMQSVTDFAYREVLPAQRCSTGGVGARYIAWAHLLLNNGRKVTAAVTHLPPKRCFGTPYNTMMRRVRAWAKNHQRHLAFGADWNKVVTTDPGNFVANTALRPRGVGIDGFQISERIPAGHAKRLGTRADYKSDHNPVKVVITR